MKNPNTYPYVILNEDFNFVQSDGNVLEDGTPDAFTDVAAALREIETFDDEPEGSVYYVAELVNLKKVTFKRKFTVESL
jgi:hypothetical protein